MNRLGVCDFSTFAFAALVAVGTGWLMAPQIARAQLRWDGNNFVYDGIAQGGSGTWDSSLTNWQSDLLFTNIAFTPTAGADFANPIGTVTLGDSLAAGFLSFQDPGYAFNLGGFTLTVSSGAGNSLLGGTGGGFSLSNGTMIFQNGTPSNLYNPFTAAQTVTVNAGATLQVQYAGNPSSTNPLGQATFELNGGLLQLRSNGTASGQINVIVGSGPGHNVVVNADSTINVDRVTANSGNRLAINDLTFNGGSNLTVTGANSYRLRVNGSVTINAPGTVLNANGARLDIEGIVNDNGHGLRLEGNQRLAFFNTANTITGILTIATGQEIEHVADGSLGTSNTIQPVVTTTIRYEGPSNVSRTVSSDLNLSLLGGGSTFLLHSGSGKGTTQLTYTGNLRDTTPATGTFLLTKTDTSTQTHILRFGNVSEFNTQPITFINDGGRVILGTEMSGLQRPYQLRNNNGAPFDGGGAGAGIPQLFLETAGMTVASNITINNPSGSSASRSRGNPTIGAQNATGTATYTGNINYNVTQAFFPSGQRILALTATQAGGTTEFAGTISQNATGPVHILKTGPGTVALTNPGANTFSGGIRVTEGTLSITSDAQLGAAPDGTIASLQVNTGGSNYAGSATVSISGGGGSGAAGEAFYEINSVTVNAGGSGYTSNPTVTFNNTGGGVGTTASSATSGGAVTAINLTGVNAALRGGYAGTTMVEITGVGTGATATANLNVISNINLSNNGTGYAWAPTVTIGGPGSGATATAYLTGGVTLDGGTLLSAANVTSNRPIEVTAAGGTLDTAGNILTLDGVVAGAGALTKNGSGTLVMTGSNLYAGGTTITAGTLLANNTVGSATGSGSVTVGSGATLGGSGFVAGDIIVTTGGILAPGNSPGVLGSAGNLDLQSGAVFSIELDGATPGNGTGFYSQFNTSGSATLAGILDASVATSFTPTGSEVFYILSRDSGTGFFTGLGEGATVTLGGGYLANITYLANWTGTQSSSSLTGGNDVALFNIQVIPEPSTWALMTLGVGAAVVAVRRRRRIMANRVGEN